MVCGIGSTGRIVFDLMQQAKKRGHTARVACSAIRQIKGASPEDVIAVGSKLDYYIHNLLSRLTDHEGLFSKSATKRLIKKIKEYDPDVIHIHNIHGHWINYEILFQYLAEANKKVIWTLHDCWAFTGHCTYFSILNCNQWKTCCTNCPGTKVYPKCYGKGDVKKNFERKRKAFTSVKDMTIITPSQWLADLVSHSFLKDYKRLVVYNGINTDSFKPCVNNSLRDRIGVQEDEIMILGVSNVWTKNKGLFDFIAMRDELPPEIKIILIGLTTKQIKELPKGIKGIERTNSVEQLVEYYSATDLFVNLTYEDNYPTVNLEAIACGTPCLTYRTGGSPESVTEKTGYIVNQGDLQSAIQIIKSINRKSAEQITACRDYALKCFQKDSFFDICNKEMS